MSNIASGDNMSRCKVCPMQSLCCADLALHASHQDPLDVVVVELGPRHGTCTVQLYSTVQYSTVHYTFCYWSQGTSKPFLLALLRDIPFSRIILSGSRGPRALFFSSLYFL